MTPRLRFGVGGVVSCMSRFIHPSKPICETYPYRPKAHKLEYLILIEESEISIRRGGGLAKVYKFLHLNFPDVIFYAAKRYVHMTLEGPAEDFFVVVEATVPQVRRQVNLTAGDMADLRRQGIATDNDNDLLSHCA